MSQLTRTFNFIDEVDYTFDSNKIEFVNGKAQLKLEKLDIDYTVDFNSDTGFTYDNTKAEFVGGKLQQKDQRPSNSILGATYNTSVDASWVADGFSSTTATLNGVPTISGNKLSCVGTQGLYYEDTQIGNLSGDWVIKFKYTPNYTTSPSTNVNLVALAPVGGGTNSVTIFNSPSGNNIRITANGLSALVFGSFTPTAGTEYTFEIICVSNVVSVYVDNVQLGTGITITPSQGTDATRLWVGACDVVYNTADGSFNDVILYSTATQTPTYTVPETTYTTTVVTTPELTKTGIGVIESFTSFATTESGSLRYTLQIDRSGNYLYWNGSAWVTSDGTYAQATDATTFNANCGSLDIDNQIYGQFKIHFTDSNTISDIDELTATIFQENNYYDDNPTVTTLTVNTDSLISLTETIEVVAGNSSIKYILYKGDQAYYHDGSNWVISNGTFNQANTIAEINANASTFTTENIAFKIAVFLNSDGTEQCAIDTLVLVYDFAPPEEDDINTCIVYGYLKDILGVKVTNCKVTVQLSENAITYKDKTIISGLLEVVNIDNDGYFEVSLVENANMNTGAYYIFNIQNRMFNKVVPNEDAKAFKDLVDA